MTFPQGDCSRLKAEKEKKGSGDRFVTLQLNGMLRKDLFSIIM
jgi:hypothetical protein